MQADRETRSSRIGCDRRVAERTWPGREVPCRWRLIAIGIRSDRVKIPAGRRAREAGRGRRGLEDLSRMIWNGPHDSKSRQLRSDDIYDDSIITRVERSPVYRTRCRLRITSTAGTCVVTRSGMSHPWVGLLKHRANEIVLAAGVPPAIIGIKPLQPRLEIGVPRANRLVATQQIPVPKVGSPL